ncbi:J domain-containing protein [Hoeflea prorocentri]|uniref:J domain-containing protein n=1 Tax=Hoeflea prorocentri TaxID=1922333 RepID=A0A9X3ULP5_9HYPH|nr:J domain-containing protein [Hoeflea prorocentri]MCY6383537.1 J domain-containing protein [Hoeflea prorocentri]MDA5401337.1 J domain-containing protein [Hoeflea prorocentri]
MEHMKLDSKYFDSIRSSKKKGKKGAKKATEAPTCQWDGCEKKGEFKAPVGRDAEGEYFMFCAEHVREYNKGYNYFSGLSDGEIARYQKEALTGHRPTWTVGVNKTSGGAQANPQHAQARSGSAAAYANMRDPFRLFEERGSARAQPRKRKLKTLEAKAFDTMGLAANATSDDIKTRYKELVKQHHPDANGGDRGSEERFREVIQAYQLLKQSGFC